jgi:hypothetical protein
MAEADNHNQESKTSKLLVPHKITDEVPGLVRRELASLSEFEQQDFVEEYQRKRKDTVLTYFLSLVYFHYAYLGRPGMTALMWLAGILSLGVVSIIWWIVDLFRIPGMVRNVNRDAAIEVMRNFRAVQNLH